MSDPLSQLRALLPLAERATVEPWDVKTREQWENGFDFFDGPDGAYTFPVDLEPEDANFIAASRNFLTPDTIRELIQRLEAQQCKS